VTQHPDVPVPLRIVVADDQASVRQGLVVLLGTLPEIEVVASPANGEEAIQLVAEKSPHAILLDLHMPVLDGIEATRRLTEQHPDVAVVVLTTYVDDSSVVAALAAGARSYLTKDADCADIVQALRSAATGLSVIDPAVRAALLSAATSRPEKTGRAEASREAARRADPTRGRDLLHDGPGNDEPRHRSRALHQCSNHQKPHQPDLRQDRIGQPHCRDPLRPRPPSRITARRPARQTRLAAATPPHETRAPLPAPP
jgi:DNA-binding NarL/FixJ family response regulator